MPRTAKKAYYTDKIYQYGIHQMLELESDEGSEAEDTLNNLEYSIAQAKRCRFGQIQSVPKQTTWLSNVLPNYDEERFQQVTRVSYADFHKILGLIKRSSVFLNKNGRQFPIAVQLAITLYRFGNYGTSLSLKNIAGLFGVGDGSTIVRITRRVISSIIELKNSYVYWPDEEERKILEKDSHNFLQGCIGFIDGTHIKLDEAPEIDSESYFDKNKNYSLQVQLVCDPLKRIRHFVLGYPGSCHDSRVFNECQISLNVNTYFTGDQFIAGDKGHPLSRHLMKPFRDNTRDMSQFAAKSFNKAYSKHRVTIEHVNGMLKETFSSLKELRVKIIDVRSHKEATRWIKACIILYNIILPQDHFN